MDNKIDFVMIWVDGNDTEWQKEKNLYDPSYDGVDNTAVRFRDWDNLQYWFRGVEKFAPWVNRIHFVTWGHLPAWLNTDNPKLNIVTHKDFIPQKYLPTFNSNAIELNLHRINGLEEQFVYFNDDMFITSPVRKEDFFINGKPLDTYGLDCIFFSKNSAGFFNGNNMEIINSNFDKNICLKKDRAKWFSLRNGLKRVIKTSALNMWPWFTGMYYDHLSSNLLKSTFAEVWEKNYEALDITCMEKFRTKANCNQWVMKFWQLAEGISVPKSVKGGHCFHIRKSLSDDDILAISSGKYKLICINDTVETADFESEKLRVKAAFEKLLPDKCEFEK